MPLPIPSAGRFHFLYAVKRQLGLQGYGEYARFFDSARLESRRVARLTEMAPLGAPAVCVYLRQKSH